MVTTHIPIYARPAPGSAMPLGWGWTGLPPITPMPKFILLMSSHLESGHYFVPQAQRIVESQASGTKVAVIDTRLSNTASKSDYWLAPRPGTEAGLLLAIANYLIQEDLYNRTVPGEVGQLARLHEGPGLSPLSVRPRDSWSRMPEDHFLRQTSSKY